MEHPNMMPNGMNGMNMPMNSMQRPQSGNNGQQVHAVIMDHLRQNLPGLGPGWQQTFDIRERAARIVQMVTQLRFLDSSMQKCCNIAESWEQKTIAESPNKEYYLAQWQEKFAEITRKRSNNVAQSGLNMAPNNSMGNMHNMNMQQAGGMNPMNGMGGMNMNMNMNPNMSFKGMGGMNMPNGSGMGMPNQMNMQQGGFPQQLQRQMQPSPMHQQPQNGSIDPSALTQNSQMQNHAQMGQPTPQQRQPQPNMNPNQGGQPNPNEPSTNEVKQYAMRLYHNMPEETRNQIRTRIIAGMSEQNRAAMHAGKHDPLHSYFIQNAREQLRKQRAQQNGAGNDQNQSGFDFSNLMGQQANAMKAQESGGEVVPASNNKSNANAMQQGSNQQQPMMNFGNNQNAGAQAQMIQLQAMQEKQRRDQMAKKNQLAQQQALAQQAQQNQLRGQPGGLNAPNALNGGQVNSPAMNMNMLNRPMVPPGQTTPSTPHQNQGAPQTPSSGANQLHQHHQNMLSQASMQVGQDGLHPQQRQYMNSLPPAIREKLHAMEPQQRSDLLEKFKAQRGQQMNQQTPAMRMGGQPMQNQHSMNAAMGNAMPGFPQHQQQGQMDPQQSMQQTQQPQQAEQNNQLRIRAMDMARYPKQVLMTLQISVQEGTDTWGKLKQHIMQNQHLLPQDLMGRLTAMQNQWFDSHPDDLKQAVERLKVIVMQRQQQQGQGQGMQMPNGQAPPAQMVAPPAQMQQPPQNQAPGGNQYITPETIAKLKAQMPNLKEMTDDQVREVMRRRRATQMAQANQDMQQSLRNAQMNAQAAQRAQQPMANGQHPPQQQAQRQQQGQQQGQKRGNSDDVVEIPNPNMQQQQPGPMQQNQQRRPGQPSMPNVPGLKTKEQLIAMPKEERDAYMRKMTEMQALRAAQIGISGATQQQQQPSQAQNVPQAQATPQQPQQQQGQQANQASPEMQQMLMKLRTMYAEVQQQNPKGPVVQLDQRGMQEARNILKKLLPIARTLDKTLIAAYRAFGEEKVREAIKIKQIIQQNAADDEGNIRDYLAVGLDTLKRSEQFIGLYMKELKAKQQQSQQQGQQGQANAQQPPKPDQPQAQQPTPATQKAQPALNRRPSQHGRKASQNKVPAAPTEDKKFDWASTTPHGVPKYDPGRTELTADKLKFPPQKKRKTTDSQSSTPAAQGTPQPLGASPHQIPGAPKRESPEQMRKMPFQQEPEKPRFNCDDVFCASSFQGFDSEEDLKKHKEQEHQSIENPLQFLTETVSSQLTALDVGQDGQPLPASNKAVASAQTAGRAPAAQKVADRRAAAASMTPALKAEAATPATPASTGKAAVKPSATPAGKKAEGIKPAEPEGEKTLYDMLVEATGAELPAIDTIAKPVEIGVPSPISPWGKHLSDMLREADDAGPEIDDWSKVAWSQLEAPFRDSAAGAAVLSDSEDSSSFSPQLTPASSIASAGGNGSGRELNITEAQRLKIAFEWDPSGNGDTAVPEGLRRLALSESESMAEVKGGDGRNGDGQKEKDPWDWSGDVVDWDAVFEPQAGYGDFAML